MIRPVMGMFLEGKVSHREIDLMLFAEYGQVLLVVHERTSRFTWTFRQPSKAAIPVDDRLMGLLETPPPHPRRSATFDNGTEFAEHHRLGQLGMRTYFRDTHAPWRKGGVENSVGRPRRLNATPGNRLGFRAPDELFSQLNRVALQTWLHLPAFARITD